MAPEGSVDNAFTGPVESKPTRPTTTTGEQIERIFGAGQREVMPQPRHEREAALLALEQEIAGSAAHVAAATHRLLTALRQFDEMDGWADYAARSCAHWLSWRIGMAPGIARENLRVARALGRLPLIDEALRTAKLSYSKARALTRVATPENESELLVTAASATAMELERVCRLFRRIAAEQIEKRPAVLADERWVRFRLDEQTGLVLMTAQLPAEEAAVLKLSMNVVGATVRKQATAFLRKQEQGADPSFDAATDRSSRRSENRANGEPAPAMRECEQAALGASPPNECVRASAHGPSIDACGTAALADLPRSLTAAARQLLFADEASGPADRVRRGGKAGAWFSHAELEQLSTFNRADALLAICESFLERQALSERRLPRYEVVVQVQRDALAGTTDEPALLEDGTAISAETARRLSCDCAVVQVETDASGDLLDVGRRTRSIPSAIRRALRLRDKTCRFPGCMQDLSLDAHHIQHWARGGATRLSNLVRLCGVHHWYVHEGGGSMRVENGALRFIDPRGRPIENAPPLVHGGNPSDELLIWLRDHGPGEGISLPLPLAYGDPADWSSVIQGWAAATYGNAVLRGDTNEVAPRLPSPDGRAPPATRH